MCPSSALRQRSLDPLVLGAFAEFTPYQCEDYLRRLFQPEGRIPLAGKHTCLLRAWIDTAIKSGLRAASTIQAAVEEEARGERRPSPPCRNVSNPERKPCGNLAGHRLGGGRWRQRLRSPVGPLAHMPAPKMSKNPAGKSERKSPFSCFPPLPALEEGTAEAGNSSPPTVGRGTNRTPSRCLRPGTARNPVYALLFPLHAHPW